MGNVNVAFQTPGALPHEWSKKHLQVGHKDLRGISAEKFPSTLDGITEEPEEKPALLRNFQNTKLPSNWTADEICAYDSHFDDLGLDDSNNVDPAPVLANFFAR